MQAIKQFFASIILTITFAGIWIWDRIQGKPQNPEDFS